MKLTSQLGSRLLPALLLLSLVLITGQSAAHDGLHDSRHEDHAETLTRQWRLNSGTTQFEGSFTSTTGEKATIHLRDGRLVTLKIDTLSYADQQWIKKRQRAIVELNHTVNYVSSSSDSSRVNKNAGQERPKIAKFFQHFVDAKSIKTRWDDDFLYVESNGIPNHQMMIGITAWQQQIPIPQTYTGVNAWQIPLKPIPAAKPMSAKTNFFRGAIALAVNGVPIFNPIKNDGKTDTNLAGELDEFGGHCGRADDYHYHLPPVHLEKVTGKGNPIAFALDGYPILGFQSKQEEANSKLDWLNGHKDEKGNYHYHSTSVYPYLNGGFYGKVVERGGQVDPQPRANPIRPALRGLRGAKITGFKKSEDGKSVSLEFKYRNESRSVSYTTKDFKSYNFSFDNGSQGKSTETYSVRPERRGGPGQDDRRKREPPRDDRNKRGKGKTRNERGNSKDRGDRSQVNTTQEKEANRNRRRIGQKPDKGQRDRSEASV